MARLSLDHATFNYITVPQLPWTQTYRWSAAAIFDDPENPLDGPSPDRIDIRNTDGSRTIIYGTGLARDLSSGFVTRIAHTTEDQLTSYFDVFGFQVHASELKVGGSAAVGDLLSIILAGDDLLFDRTSGPSSERSVVLVGYAGHDTFYSQGLALIDGGPNPSGVPIRNALNYESIDGSVTVLQAAYGTRGTASLRTAAPTVSPTSPTFSWATEMTGLVAASSRRFFGEAAETTPSGRKVAQNRPMAVTAAIPSSTAGSALALSSSTLILALRPMWTLAASRCRQEPSSKTR